MQRNDDMWVGNPSAAPSGISKLGLGLKRCLNKSGEAIPAGSLGLISDSGGDSNEYWIVKPDADNISPARLVITPWVEIPNIDGIPFMARPATSADFVAVDAAVTAGETGGSAEDSWEFSTDNKGFDIILGGDSKAYVQGGGSSNSEAQGYVATADNDGSRVATENLNDATDTPSLEWPDGVIPPRKGAVGVGVAGQFLLPVGGDYDNPLRNDAGLDGSSTPSGALWEADDPATNESGETYGVVTAQLSPVWDGTTFKFYKFEMHLNANGQVIRITAPTLARTIETTTCEMPEAVDALTGLTLSAGGVLYCVSTSVIGTTPSTSFGRALLQLNDAAGMRTAAALGSFAVENTNAVPDLTMADGKNIATNTTTGTKFGTATGQKIGFWNATPVIQPAHADQAAASQTAPGTLGTFTPTTLGSTWDATAASDANAMFSSLASLLSAQASINSTQATNTSALATLLAAVRSALVAIGLMKGSA